MITLLLLVLGVVGSVLAARAILAPATAQADAIVAKQNARAVAAGVELLHELARRDAQRARDAIEAFQAATEVVRAMIADPDRDPDALAAALRDAEAARAAADAAVEATRAAGPPPPEGPS